MPASPPTAPPRAASLLRESLQKKSTQRRLLCLFLWAVCLVAVAHRFEEPAAVQLFVTASAFALLLTNFAARPRGRDELSAYAAFNPGGMALLGTLRAEQLDAEVRHRPPEWGLDDGRGAQGAGGGGAGRAAAGERGERGGWGGREESGRDAFAGRGRVLGGAGGGAAAWAEKEKGAEEEKSRRALEETRREIFLEARRGRLAAAAARRRG